MKTPQNTARLEESTTGHNGLDAPLISDAMQCVSESGVGNAVVGVNARAWHEGRGREGREISLTGKLRLTGGS